jgi:hypothetical protein
MPEIKYVLDQQFSETEELLKKFEFSIPRNFSNRLRHSWINTLIFLNYGYGKNLAIQDQAYIESNEIWLNQLATQYSQLEIEKLNVKQIVDFYMPVFQQAVFLLLLTQEISIVLELLDSTIEILPIFYTRKRDYLEEILQKKALEKELGRRYILERETQREALKASLAKENLFKFKIEALQEISSSIFVGTKDKNGEFDNGSSWGVLKKNIYSQYSIKVHAKILNYYGRSKESTHIKSIFEEDANMEFDQFLDSLGCKDYRGNLRRFLPFPIEIFRENQGSINSLKKRYADWDSAQIHSVLTSERGNIPDSVRPFLLGWKAIERYIEESHIFLLDSLGLTCSYHDFNLAFHFAFVGCKPEPRGLRGQWMIIMTGIPKQFH